MKKIIFTLILFTQILSLQAQEITLSGVNKGFKGIFPMQDDNTTLTYYIADKTGSKDEAELVIYLLNSQLGIVDSGKAPVSKNASIITAELNMSTVLFLLADPVKKTITTLGYEMKKGVVKNTVQSKLPDEYFTADYKASIHSVMPDGFVIVTPILGKKRGYQLESLDRECNTRWSKTFVPEKGNWDVFTSQRTMERLVIVRKETNGNKFQFNVISVQSEQGDVMFDTELKDGDDYFYPTSLNPMFELLSIGGVYYKDGNTNNQPKGIFLLQLGPANETRQLVKRTIEQVAQETDPKIATALQSGDYRIFVENFMRKPSGGLLGIAEMYSIIPGADDKTLRLGNLIFFTTKDNSDIQHMDSTVRIDVVEQNPREAIVKNTGTRSDLEIAQWLFNNQFFSYRSSLVRGPDGKVLYKNNDSLDSKAYFLSVTESFNREMPFERIYRGNGDEEKPKKSDGKYYYDMNNPYELNKFLYKDARLLQHGTVQYYDYAPPKLKIWRGNML